VLGIELSTTAGTGTLQPDRLFLPRFTGCSKRRGSTPSCRDCRGKIIAIGMRFVQLTLFALGGSSETGAGVDSTNAVGGKGFVTSTGGN
jgi:hypothetical protein